MIFQPLQINRVDGKYEKYMRKALYQRVDNATSLTLDDHYVEKILSRCYGESNAVTSKLKEILFDSSCISLEKANGMSFAAHQVLCLKMWMLLVLRSLENEFLPEFGLSISEFQKLVWLPIYNRLQMNYPLGTCISKCYV